MISELDHLFIEAEDGIRIVHLIRSVHFFVIAYKFEPRFRALIEAGIFRGIPLERRAPVVAGALVHKGERFFRSEAFQHRARIVIQAGHIIEVS